MNRLYPRKAYFLGLSVILERPVLLSLILLDTTLYYFVYRKDPSGRKTPEPVFRNPRVGALFMKWRTVWLIAMDRNRKLQDALDYLKEVILLIVIFWFWLKLYSFSCIKVQIDWKQVLSAFFYSFLPSAARQKLMHMMQRLDQIFARVFKLHMYTYSCRQCRYIICTLLFWRLRDWRTLNLMTGEGGTSSLWDIINHESWTCSAVRTETGMAGSPGRNSLTASLPPVSWVSLNNYLPST